MESLLVAATILAALGFSFVNGATDAPHVFAPPVRTGALTPRIAMSLGALLTALGALFGSGIASTALEGTSFPSGHEGLVILLSGALAAIIWGIVAHALSMPTSSTHALLGAITGASAGSLLTGGSGVALSSGALLTFFVLPLLLSPGLAFLSAYAASRIVVRLRHNSSVGSVHRASRILQSISSGTFAVGHGLQDGARTVFLLTAALTWGGHTPEGRTIPWVIIFLSAGALGLGAFVGSWRIGRTLSHRMTRLTPMSGSIGSASATLLLFVAGIGFHVPLSSTHLSTSGLLGASASTPSRVTRWREVLKIIGFWLLTPLFCAGLGLLFFLSLGGA